MAGVAVSFAVFATVRSFAKGSPSTMTKEYQEASNEYMKVRLHHAPLQQSSGNQPQCVGNRVLTAVPTGTKHRANLRYLLRGLQRPRNGPVPTKEVNTSHHRGFLVH